MLKILKVVALFQAGEVKWRQITVTFLQYLWLEDDPHTSDNQRAAVLYWLMLLNYLSLIYRMFKWWSHTQLVHYLALTCI